MSLIIFNSLNVGFGLGNNISLVKKTDDFYAIGILGCLISLIGILVVVFMMIYLGVGYG